MNIYRKGSEEKEVVATLKKFEYSGTAMGERKITASLESPVMIDFMVGDYVIYTIDNRQDVFVLDAIPNIKKVSSARSIGNAFQYNLTFLSLQYELTTVQMRDIVNGDNKIYTGKPDFTFYGNAEDLCSRIEANLNVRFPSLWSFDLSESAKNTDYYEITFSGENCFEALSNLNNKETFNLKFRIEGRVIKVGYESNIVSLSNGTPFFLKYGKSSHKPIEDGGGLYTIERVPDNQGIITRLRAYGGTQNVNLFYNKDDEGKYRYSTNIMLPDYNINGKDYIDADQETIDYYGIREGSVIFEDIYPTIKEVKMGDFPKDIVSIEVFFENGATYLRLYKYTENGKEDFYATTNILVTVRNQSTKKAVVRIYINTNMTLCVDKDDNAIKFEYKDDFFFTDVRIESTDLHSDDGIYYVPYCYSPPSNVGVSEDDRIDEIVAFSQPENPAKDDTFEIYIRDLGFNIGRTLDYDVDTIANVWHLNGTSITFNSGLLGGNTFELAAYDGRASVEKLDVNDTYYNLGARYVIRLKYIEDEETKYILPNETITAKGGDSFVITGLDMPLLYHYWAENRLLEKAQEYLDENCKLRQRYNVEFDNQKLAMHPTIAMQLCEGNSVSIVDEDFQTKRLEENNLIEVGEGKLGGLGEIDVFGRFDTMPDSAIAGETVICHLDKGDYSLLAKSIRTDVPIELYIKQNGIKTTIDTIQNEDGYSKTINVPELSEFSKSFGQKDNAINSWVGKSTNKVKTENSEIIVYDEGGVGVEFHNVEERESRYRYITHRGENQRGTILTRKFATIFTECKKFCDQHINESTTISDDNGFLVWCELTVEGVLPRKLRKVDENGNDVGSVKFEVAMSYVGSNGSHHLSYATLHKENDAGRYRCILNPTLKKGAVIDLYLCIGTCNHEELISEEDKFINPSFVFDGYVFKYNGNQKEKITPTITIREKAALCISNNSNSQSDIKIEDAVLIEGVHNYETSMSATVLEIEQCNIKVECADDFSPNADKKTFSATLSNRSFYSGLQKVLSDIKNNTNNIKDSQKDIASLVQTSRKTQKNLDVLEKNIFAPDGSVQNTFVSTMMSQVGADSMNYFLELTRISVNGEMNNVSYNEDTDTIEFGNDILHHYEYKCGEDFGNWSIEQPATFDLKNGGGIEIGDTKIEWSADPDGEKVFFVAICCNKNKLDEALWIISDKTDILKVENESLPNHYIFNYAIISAMKKNEDGTIIEPRSITETRGKSYAYGDNIITGIISSMNGMTWINLVDGTFNFGDKLILDENGNLINNGMILSNRIEVKDGDKTIAGMNGILDQEDKLGSPAFWAGGTYDEATKDKTNMMINHKGLGRIGVLRYFADWVLVKTKGFLNTVLSAVGIDETKRGIGTTETKAIVENSFTRGGVLVKDNFSINTTANANNQCFIYYNDIIYLDMLEAQQDDCAIWMSDPVKKVALYLGGFSLKIGQIANGLNSYLLKYTVQFEIFFNNGFKNTRIGTIPYSKVTTLIETSKKPTYLQNQDIDVTHELYKAVTGGWEPTSWSGFQFSGKEGDRDSFFFVKKGYEFKIGIRPTIRYTAVGFSGISLVYNNAQFRFTFEGDIYYKEMMKTSIIANDGLSIEIGSTSNFSIKENTNDTSGEMPSLEMSFVGKVRQGGTTFRSGKLQSLPNGVLYLSDDSVNGFYLNSAIDNYLKYVSIPFGFFYSKNALYENATVVTNPTIYGNHKPIGTFYEILKTNLVSSKTNYTVAAINGYPEGTWDLEQGSGSVYGIAWHQNETYIYISNSFVTLSEGKYAGYSFLIY